ncbi:IclR family transcriptional regulator [Streptosporangium sp. NPDC051023]|uniref:IclR family transcriptional regulator n=1 Tax=Streptosporangium sp. NPDC051023 TaxID=3155410 RepID=UPI00344CEA9E
MTKEMSKDPGQAQGLRNNSASLRRALSILLQLGHDTAGSGFSLVELSTALEMNKSTLLRLLQPLVEARFVEQLSSGYYRLGWRNAQLGQVYLAGVDLHRNMKDVLQRLATQTGETAHLVIADFPSIVYVDKVDSPHPVRMVSRIGNQQPAYSTSLGKAMLAHAPDETVEMVISNGMPARTPYTITTARGLREELAAIRERGYAIDDVENEEGIRCVAAPVFDQSGASLSGISVSGPVERVTPEKAVEFGPLVIAAANEISRRLGAKR